MTPKIDSLDLTTKQTERWNWPAPPGFSNPVRLVRISVDPSLLKLSSALANLTKDINSVEYPR